MAGFILILFGVIILATSIGLFINHNIKAESWIMSTGTISKVDHGDEYVMYTYEYDNVKYNVKNDPNSGGPYIWDMDLA